MAPRAMILDCAGEVLTDDERAFFRDANPWGFILFLRNCSSPEQVRKLCGAMREAVGRADAPILIDQEGGRVARLKPPHWRRLPAGARYGDLHEMDAEQGKKAAYLYGRVLASELYPLGVTVDCAPILDVPVAGGHDVIGDRAYSHDPNAVSILGRAVSDGLMAGGVLPIIKHIPGHGRAFVDSHDALPVVDASAEDLRASDFAPFRALADLPMAMTAHVIYTAYDDAQPATLSSTVIEDVIRGDIGFDGLLMTDDLSMGALAGGLGARTAASFAAGCDIALYCNGDVAEKMEVAAATEPLSGRALARAEAALQCAKGPDEGDPDADFAALGELLGAVGGISVA